jgi:hypothetical protein
LMELESAIRFTRDVGEHVVCAEIELQIGNSC